VRGLATMSRRTADGRERAGGASVMADKRNR
jgi:hypothetical protein